MFFGFGKKKRKAADQGKPVGMAEAPSGRVVRKVPELVTMAYKVRGNRQYQQDDLYVSGAKLEASKDLASRMYQEDDLYVFGTKRLASNKKTRVLAVVCDGMGGMADGGRASSTAIQMMREAFQKMEKLPEVDIPSFFRQGIFAIDRAIASFPKENGKGSGTTMVACIVEDNRLYWASVGDSRIYIIRGNEMRRVTTDHNYWLRLQNMVDTGQITKEEAMAARHKEALISFLGMGNISLMDVRQEPLELKFGDVVMLCSDGITKTLTDTRIREIITKVPPKDRAQALIQAATRENTHSQDNTSVALICYREVDIKSKGESL